MIDLSQPAEKRICLLSRPDNTPISDTDIVTLAVNRVRAADLVESSRIFPAGEPHAEIIQGDVHGEFSGLREMIGAYLTESCKADGTFSVSAPEQEWHLSVSSDRTM